MTKRLVTLLARPWSPWIAALLGMALALPALGGGLFGDDYLQRSVLLGVGDVGKGARPVFDLFAFIPQGPRHDATLDLGILTWWAHPELSLALFRPVTALTHMLDYALWPDALWAQHLQSVLWYGLAIFLVARLYRWIHGAGAIAGLAAVLFAVDGTHAMSVGWLANRHALIALVTGIYAVQAHIRSRRGEGRHWSTIAIVAFAAGLLCSEATLAAAAYIVAWELTMERAPARQRIVALVPYAVLVVAWRVMYTAFGYGTHGTALYVDPGQHPMQFLVALGERWPILQLAQWFSAPVDVYVMLSRAGQIALAGIAVAACAFLVWVFTPLVMERREARFWSSGMCLALVPVCAAFPMDRLVLFAGVGAAPLLVLLVERVGLLSRDACAGTRSRFRIAVLLLLIHGPLAAGLLVARVTTLPYFGAVFNVSELAPADEHAPQQTYVFVNGNEFPVVYVAIMRQLETPRIAPRRVALLASMFTDAEIYREDAQTLVITADGGFLRETLDQLLRDVGRPFQIGERIERRDFTAAVRAITPDGRPLQVAFQFRAPLESAEFRWLAWGASGVDDFRLPSVGSRVKLPAVSLLAALRAGERANHR